MKLKVLKSILVTFVLLSVFNLSLSEIKVTAQTEPYLAIMKTKTGSNTDPAQPVSNLLDGNSGTCWGISSGASSAWAEFDLAQSSLIHGLEITGTLGNANQLVIEYRSDGDWIPFLTGNFDGVPTNGIIDLSYDRVVTDAVRIRLSGNSISQCRLSELKIIGADATQILHRIQPQTVTESDNTSPTNPAEFLTDGNTYTQWQTKPRWYPDGRYDPDLDDLFKSTDIGVDIGKYFTGKTCQVSKGCSGQGQVLFELAQTATIKNINIYFTKYAQGDFSIQIPQGNGWQQIGLIHAGQPVGWYRLDLSGQAVSTSKVQLTVSGNNDVLGGISEVELWGYGEYVGDSHLALLSQPGLLSDSLNYQFELTEEQLPDNYLELALREI